MVLLLVVVGLCGGVGVGGGVDGGTARCAGWRIQQVLVTSKPQSSAGAQYRHTSRV